MADHISSEYPSSAGPNVRSLKDFSPAPVVDSDGAESKRICIIGAGANGLGTLKVLADTPQVQSGLWTPIAYEEREDIGGIWLPSPPTGNPPASPLYDSLTTNIPHPIMAYASFDFPPSSALYPTAAAVQQYLLAYAAHFGLRRFVQFRTRVEEARWDAARAVWRVRLSTGEQRDFDFIVVANGHYRKPRYPAVPGLQKWLDEGRAIHSAWYRRPCDFAHHQKVLVVGGGPSAIDISTELRTVVPLLLHSVPSLTPIPGNFVFPDDTSTYRKVPRVAEYRDNGALVYVDGTTESGVDLVILGTGYETTFEFLPRLDETVPPVPPPLPSHLHNSTYHAFPLAKHLFPLQADFPPASIAFPGLPIRVAPFPLFEDQARAIVRVLADPTALDTTAEAVDIVARAQALVEEEGTADALRLAQVWFRFAQFEPFEYRAELNTFANGGEAWAAPKWELEVWDRKIDLRTEWNALVKAGQADVWVKDVGNGGQEEWVDLCYRLIKRFDERAADKAKL
ncbi:FAD/NAD(P)-binding domain-containing protein [Auriscalpium vulgare]|uniref:FAD/NAD(P)-binding domain-containing protein n=1 Tax=Auriscalpium vulgare TaxID=40419 RepID=A0ACB8S7D3_9AGAM|nr:FAD/NAD(P)-binding domain-containing protein [Auriscalpium vulgare]